MSTATFTTLRSLVHGEPSRGLDAAANPMRLSSDGKLLLALLALILVGPYLPILALTNSIGIELAGGQNVARLDNVALPVVALFVLVRSVARHQLVVPIHSAFYVAFLLWIVLMTPVWWQYLPGGYSGADATGLVRHVDAYGRPLFIFLIAANVRITSHDFRMLVRLVLGVGLLLGVLSAMQLHEATAGPVNRFLFDFYDNNNGEHFWGVVGQGRAAALMPQLSTLGMYVVLAFGLLATQVIGGRSISSPIIFGLLAGGVFLGGLMSGSKVFVGGTGLLVIGLILTIGMVRREAVGKILAAVVALAIVWIFASAVFPEQAARASGKVVAPVFDGVTSSEQTDPSNDLLDSSFYGNRFQGVYDVYLSTRLDSSTGKVFRSGAMDIAGDYPITGLGLNVVGRTTDSMALGIFIMGGAIGSVLYLAMLVTVAVGLFRISRRRSNPEAAATAKVFLILTVIFAIGSVGFHTFIQDRAGDAYWLLVGLLLQPLAASQSGGSIRKKLFHS